MRKCVLIAVCLTMTLGLCGCQPNPNAEYTLYFPGMNGVVTPVTFASPYDDPSMYRGGGR
jgi:hypothetical protein